MLEQGKKIIHASSPALNKNYLLTSKVLTFYNLRVQIYRNHFKLAFFIYEQKCNGACLLYTPSIFNEREMEATMRRRLGTRQIVHLLTVR